MALDVSPDRKVMYVHVMYIDTPTPHAEIKDGFERRVLQVLADRSTHMLDFTSALTLTMLRWRLP